MGLPSSAMRLPSSATRLPSSAMRLPSSAMRLPSSAMRLLRSATIRRLALTAVPLVLALLVGCDPALDDEDPSEPRDRTWEAWLDVRDDALVDLGAPIVDCTQQQDTAAAAFGGCWDWHSAVHGVWALHALGGLLDDPSYVDVADSLLTPEALAAELADVQVGRPFNEVPYGFAWLLRLVVERASLGNDDALPLGDAAAGHLVTWVEELPPGAWDVFTNSDDYDSLPWALVNLHRWATWNGDSALAAFTVDYARDAVLPFVCAFEDEEGFTDDFFPPCLHGALALTTLLPASERDAWLDDWLPLVPALAPIEEPTRAHSAGLNFSRAWGLWALHRATGERVYRDLWLDHVQTHLARPDLWREDYQAHSHWIPQFGVLAIALSEEDQ